MAPELPRNSVPANGVAAKRAWLFPGQGTQRRGMGAEYFGLYPNLVATADSILGFSIKTLCLDDPNNQLGDTEFSQPAMFIVGVLEFLHKRRTQPWPDVVAGHSLGEYNALFAAGAFDFETGLRIVQARAQAMRSAGTGSMLAVIGMDQSEVLGVMKSLGLDGIVEFANFNLPDQIVLSGPDQAINALEEQFLTLADIRAVHLRVGGAFHSRYAQSAADQFEQGLAGFPLCDPKICTISSSTAQQIQPGEVRSVLSGQITRPVNWVGVMTFLQEMGVNDAQQIGPGRVLDGLWERFHDASIRRPGTKAERDRIHG